ncbi:hypothetical protein TWF694_002021 [Orbilia ellipsospora]|uniref:PNPLA domain-containing protein n=1 Tax=Orbilia ellipsospora TaxID=2528407 RepID=A0AAV9X5M3_9PEZI
MSYAGPSARGFGSQDKGKGRAFDSSSSQYYNNDQQIAFEIAQERAVDPTTLESEHPLVREQFAFLSRTSNEYTYKPQSVLPSQSWAQAQSEPQAPATENCALEAQSAQERINKREQDKIPRADKNKQVPPLPNGTPSQGLRGWPPPEYPEQAMPSFPNKGSEFALPRRHSMPPSPLPLSPRAESIDLYGGGDDQDPATPDEPLRCEICDCSDRERKCMVCNVCQMVFCETCWPEYIPHKSGRKNPIRGIRLQKHEPIDPVVEAKLDRILEPQITEYEQESLLDQDEDTAWFAVVKDESDDLIFQDLGRYGNLVAGLHKKSHPALVSFVGPTGSGKSTLIKMLMELDYAGVQPYETPVVKSAACFGTLPTSGDVHLFCDPHTCKPDSDRPILYADCEGLEGGERTPLGSRTLKREKIQKKLSKLSDPKRSRDQDPKQEIKPSFSRRSRTNHQSSERELKWANSDMTRRREFVVSELYPRILYTFSDVVVFVIKETNKLESVIERLLMWAAAALEKSSNQPILPHAIIAMNSIPNEAADPFWDINTTTSDVLNEVNLEFTRNPKFKPYIRYWEERNTRVSSVWGLLHLYYDSVKVIRIPRKGRSTLIKEQVIRLYNEIKICVQHSHRMKRERRMLMTARTLQTHLQSAYDHFANSLDTSFDFVKATFAHSPIPSDFGGNILKLILAVKKNYAVGKDGAQIFRMVGPMIASCIMLDAARQRIAGTAFELFPEYSPSCSDAFNDFIDKHWECEYSDPEDPSIRCVNYRVGHTTKGHQDASGKIIATGDYICSFRPGYFEIWRDLIIAYLISIENRLNEDVDRDTVEERTLVSKIHRDEYMAPFYYSVAGSERYISHSACLVCLVHSPEHHLQCGHIICTPCLQTYGNQKPGCIAIENCPMHPLEQIFWPPQIFTVKPPSAGVRILTLDGGGIRGLSQLIILEHLENALGSDLQVTSFFDLVVGSSTGAQIALGLVVKNWTIAKCMSQFQELCRESFTPRKWGGTTWPKVHQLVGGLVHKYRTQPLQAALMNAFSADECLFGGIKTSSKPAPKVAVTTTSSAGKAIVLGNYNRTEGAGVSDGSGISYDFPRSEQPEDEFKVWEAARATAAAPRYFKEFSHLASKDVYLDGGIYHMNPIYIANAERKLIWPEVEHLAPDIVLSLGSGYNPHPKPRKPKKFRSKGAAQVMERLQWIATNHIASSIAGENIWNNWIAENSTNTDDSNRYVRFNVQFSQSDDPPHFDDMVSMGRVEFESRKQIYSFGKKIKLLADHLICSTFYFVLIDSNRYSDANGKTREIRCKGSIHCRFSPHTTDIRKLGMFFQSLNDRRNLGSSWKPYFILRERSRERSAQVFPITETITSRMLNRSSFEFPEIEFTASSEDAVIEISLRLDKTTEFPISGFPGQILNNVQNGIVPRKLSWRRMGSRKKERNSDEATTGSSSSVDLANKSPTPGLSPDSRKSDPTRAHALNYNFASLFRPKSGTPSKVPDNIFELPAEVPNMAVEADSGIPGQN